MRLEIDTKHSEVQNFVLITQRAASKRAFIKRRLDRSENTNSETESRVISQGMGNRFCNAALPCFVIVILVGTQ